ncbi:MAG: TolC family protein [Bdellovibrionales bacterium]|nr:TolC family protein [Bdellovibrionales bacterium]
MKIPIRALQILLLIHWFLLAPFLPAYAETPLPTLSLDKVRSRALVESPEVRKIDATLSAKIAQALSLEQLQNPQLQGSVGIPASYDGQRPDSQLNLTLSQPLRLSDFGNRSTVGSLIRSVASREKQFELQSFLVELTVAYCSLWAAQIEEGHLEEQLDRANSVYRLVKQPTAIGQFRPPQKHTAKATVAKLEAALLGMMHSKAKLKATLTRLTGFTIGEERLVKPEIESLPPFSRIWTEVKANEQGLIKRYMLQSRLDDEKVRLADTDTLSAGIQPQIGYARNEDGNHFVGLGFTIPLPFFNTNNGNREAARATRDQSSAFLSYFKSKRFKEEFKLLYDGATAKYQQANKYEEEVLPALRSALKSSEELFQNGQLSLFELWTAQTDYHAALDRTTELFVEAFQDHLQLSLISGDLTF